MMDTVFVDTNIFLRLLIGDNSAQYHKARELISSVSGGNIELLTTTLVLFECHWVLTSSYEKNKKDVISLLKKILALSFITIPQREAFESAVTLYEEHSLSLEDCFHIESAKYFGANKFATFDKKLEKISKDQLS